PSASSSTANCSASRSRRWRANCAAARSRPTPAPTDARRGLGAARRKRAGVRRRALARCRGRALAAVPCPGCGRGTLRSVGGVACRQRGPCPAGGTGATWRRRVGHRRSTRTRWPAPRLPAVPHPEFRAGMKSATHPRRTVPMTLPLRLSPRLSPRLSLFLPLLLLAACAGGGGARPSAAEGARIAPPVAAGSATASAPEAAPVTALATGTVAATEAPSMPGAVPAPADPAMPQAVDAQSVATADPTQAELDYAAIYGQSPYDPVADPSLPAPAQLPSSYDPWENWNRKVHRFNNAVDRTVATPLAKAYVKVVPRPVRLGVGNFFNNLG